VNKPVDNTRRGRLRALLAGWVKPGASGSRLVASAAEAAVPVRIGRYAIARQLGQGGMGIVYAAVDEQLERPVAVKTMKPFAGDDTARKRFWREARAAASVNHPHICHLYEIGEDGGELFIAMELLEGEPLSERLRRGPLRVSEALPIALEILDALQALHARGIVHRDLKPSNVFLTPHGVKLLDFGLARPIAPELAAAAGSAGELTGTGVLVGTPRYMAPEQVTGEGLDERSDLFAVGAVLFEMLAGRPAFDGRNAVEILHATLYEQPPALTGSPAVAAADRVVRRALAKRPSERPATAAALAEELRAGAGTDGDGAAALAHALTRIVVLPFRVLRPDAETDFLAFSLPDAIATSLSDFGSLVVRSGAVAARFAGETPDLKRLAVEADVDRVVMGTLVRAGDQLRATTQLVDAPAGTLLASHAVQSPLGDLFRLQDDIARRVVEALALPLTRGSDTTLHAPNARAYALYLQANELARRYDQLPQARGLYERSLELDPRFALAWAQLGRCHRVIGKYVEASADSALRAEQALRRSLELNPRLSLAHRFYAQVEAETGHPRDALVRLLGEAARHGNDPELFAGLVHACRYCGLFEQSIAAHDEARRLDPNVPTSVEQTVMMTCDVERLLAVPPPLRGGGDQVIRVIGLGLAGRRDEARQLLAALRQESLLPLFHSYADTLLAWLDRRAADMASAESIVGGLKIAEDPEAIFQEGWLLCDVGEHARGLERLRQAVAMGYCVAATLSDSRAFDGLRTDPAFEGLLAKARAGREQALAAFREAGGERLLGR
jgi:eukaryotic-like serine/threonine-protein kinase